MPLQKAIVAAAKTKNSETLQQALAPFQSQQSDASRALLNESFGSAVEQLALEDNVPVIYFLLMEPSSLRKVSPNNSGFYQHFYKFISHLSCDIVKQLAYLSFFDSKDIRFIVENINKRWINRPNVEINKSTEERALAISKYMRKDNLSYALALTKTNQENHGWQYLLMMLSMQQDQQRPRVRSSLESNLWLHVFSFLSNAPLNKQNVDSLRFVIERNYLTAQLKSYQLGYGFHKGRALSFFNKIARDPNQDMIKKEISGQVQILQGHNPYRLLERGQEHRMNVQNPVPDRFYGIIGFWEKGYTGKAAIFEEDETMVVPSKISLA